MSGPMLSILISCYNQRYLIADAITSCFEQDWENREIVVLDDGSGDDSMKIIAECAAKAPCPVRFFTQQNHGPAAVYRKLAEMANGAFLLFLGGDDFIPPNSLKTRMELLQNDPSLMLASGVGRIFRDGTPGDFICPAEKMMLLNRKDARYMLDTMKLHRPQDGCLPFQATIFRKDDYLAAGGFPENMICDDVVLFFNMFTHAVKNGRRFAVVPDMVLFYRQHDSNISKDPQEMWLRFSELYNKLGFKVRRQASFSAYALYMKEVRTSGKWFHKELLRRIFRDPAVIKYLTLGAICRDILFPRYGRF